MDLEEQIEFTKEQQLMLLEGSSSWEMYRNIQISLENHKTLVNELEDCINYQKYVLKITSNPFC